MKKKEKIKSYEKGREEKVIKKKEVEEWGGERERDGIRKSDRMKEI